jgi:hypothetical protein
LRRVYLTVSFRRMSDDVLYRRRLPHGPDVRIRRTTAAGVTPVTAVIDVDRRSGIPRENDGGPPPALKTASAPSEAGVLAALKADADDDRAIASLLRAKGLR